MLTPTSLLTADAGYHSEEHLKALEAMNTQALIADNRMRQRDPRFDSQDHHKAKPDPLYDKSARLKEPTKYRSADFNYDPVAQTCVCPAGNSLYHHGKHCVIGDFISVRFRGAQRDCGPCTHRERCLRHPDKSKTRQVAFFLGTAPNRPASHTDRMKKHIDSPKGRERYGQCFATVAPVFGNLRYNKRLSRFTLRGRTKVNAQWQLFCLVHNIEKLANLRHLA